MSHTRWGITAYEKISLKAKSTYKYILTGINKEEGLPFH